MSSSVIAVNALTKRYAARTGTVSALEEISFSVGEGEFVAVVGPSGCGKSTLLKILAGILPSTAGEARLRGTAIAGPRKDIGVVFQAPVLFPWRSVLDNVRTPDAPAEAIIPHGPREERARAVLISAERIAARFEIDRLPDAARLSVSLLALELERVWRIIHPQRDALWTGFGLSGTGR